MRAVRARARRERAAAAAVFVVSGFHSGTWSSRIPAVREAVGASSAELGLALSGSGLGLLAGIAVASQLSGRLSGGRWAALGCALYAATLALLGITPTFPALLVALILTGLASGLVTVTENAVGASLERAQRRPAMSMLFGVMSAAVLAGGATGALAAYFGVSPAVHFGSVAAVLVLVGLVSGPGISGRPAAAVPRRRAPPLLEPSGRTWLLALMAFVAVLTYGTTMDWSGVYLSADLQAGQAVAAAAPTVFVSLICVGRLAGNVAVRHIGGAGAVRAGAAVGAVGMVTLAVAPDSVTALVGLGLLGAGLSCVLPLVTAAAATAARHPGRAMGLVSLVANAAYLVGPPAVGVTAGGPGLPAVFLGLTVPMLATAALARTALGCPNASIDMAQSHS